MLLDILICSVIEFKDMLFEVLIVIFDIIFSGVIGIV